MAVRQRAESQGAAASAAQGTAAQGTTGRGPVKLCEHLTEYYNALS